MPPQRMLLRDLSVNIKTRGTELSPYERGIVVGAHKSSVSVREISRDLKRSRTTIDTALNLYSLDTKGYSLSWSSRPRIYTEHKDRAMIRHLRKYPKSTFLERRTDCSTAMSNTYIKNLARANGLIH